jgi:hypothetical protein
MERRLLSRGGMLRRLLVPVLAPLFLVAATSLSMISTAQAATGGTVTDRAPP